LKLHTSPASPFGRTVAVVAHELGLAGDIEIVPTGATPTKQNATLEALNPLRRIPVLERDDGTALTDSTLIAQYLASEAGNRSLFAEDAPDRFAMLNDYMLAKGAAECLVAARYETFVRPVARRWQPWSDDLLGKVHAALARLAAAPPPADEAISIAAIALGVTLGYADYRFAGEDWRARHPALADWSAAVFERPSFAATQPG